MLYDPKEGKEEMTTKDREKVDTLIEIEGFEDLQMALTEWSSDSVVPGICYNDGCNNVEDVEPDCEDGYCTECDTQTVKSPLKLLEMI